MIPSSPSSDDNEVRVFKCSNKPRRRRHAFSLLEVIIATAILAASGVMLLSMFSTGDRHSRRADERAISHMLCQSKLEELLTGTTPLIPIEADIFRQYPGWVYSIAVEPTALEGFIQLTVSVTHIPGTKTGANLELATTSSESQPDVASISNMPSEPTYQLVRWMEFDGDLTGFTNSTSTPGLGL